MNKLDRKEEYSPLYFLASLGAGGLAVTFFLYPMFMVEHPDTPMVTFDHVFPLLMEGSAITATLLTVALVGIAIFSIQHFRLLWWNLRAYRAYRTTAAYRKLKRSNSEVALMTIPLTLAMSINVLFILGAVFIPGLWDVVEYLFPLAIAGYLTVGVYALKIFGEYMTRLVTDGSFDFRDNSNLSQMVAIFAFSMVAVGLAAPGAMSHHVEINAVGIFLSIFFASIAVLLGVVKFVLGFKSILRNGMAQASAPSLWIMIPIFTLLGITIVRLTFGLHHGFDVPLSMPSLFVITSVILSLEILFGIIGLSVMKRLDYFTDFLHGSKRHPGSFALICPGVAFFVFGMFFIVFGLIKNGLVEKFSPTYFALLVPLVYIQVKSILTFLKLSRRLPHPPERMDAQPALG